jgi:ribulose-phosphate 3-epimerase
VDGGVDPTNAGRLVSAGASILVAGQAIFGAPDIAAAIRALRAAAEAGAGAGRPA